MAFTYTNPSNSPQDAVRFLVGDVDPTEPLLQDEEIEWLMTTWGSGRGAYFLAYKAADAIASKLAREIDINADGQNLALNGLMEKYRTLALSLLSQHKELLGDGVEVYVGGVDVTEQHDPSVRPPSFGTRMHDNLEAGRQDYGEAGDIPDAYSTGQWGEVTS